MENLPTNEPYLDIEVALTHLRDGVYKAGRLTLGMKKRRTPDWFNENNTIIKVFIQEKREMENRDRTNPGDSSAKRQLRTARGAKKHGQGDPGKCR